MPQVSGAGISPLHLRRIAPAELPGAARRVIRAIRMRPMAILADTRRAPAAQITMSQYLNGTGLAGSWPLATELEASRPLAAGSSAVEMAMDCAVFGGTVSETAGNKTIQSSAAIHTTWRSATDPRFRSARFKTRAHTRMMAAFIVTARKKVVIFDAPPWLFQSASPCGPGLSLTAFRPIHRAARTPPARRIDRRRFPQDVSGLHGQPSPWAWPAKTRSVDFPLYAESAPFPQEPAGSRGRRNSWAL